jgi:hypothetical protein
MKKETIDQAIKDYLASDTGHPDNCVLYDDDRCCYVHEFTDSLVISCEELYEILKNIKVVEPDQLTMLKIELADIDMYGTAFDSTDGGSDFEEYYEKQERWIELIQQIKAMEADNG